MQGELATPWLEQLLNFPTNQPFMRHLQSHDAPSAPCGGWSERCWQWVWLNWNNAKAAKQLKIPPTPAERDAWRCRTAAGGSHQLQGNPWFQWSLGSLTCSYGGFKISQRTKPEDDRHESPKAVRGFKESAELPRKLRQIWIHLYSIYISHILCSIPEPASTVSQNHPHNST